MRSILVLNAKGGCGKTTIATNLAGYFAERGKKVALADFDPQGSSIDWLSVRPENRPPIHGISAWEDSFRLDKSIEILIIDSPAAVDEKALTGLVKRAQSIIVPVLPSIIDIRAAQRFMGVLLELKRVLKNEVKLATVANRVRDHTLAAEELNQYLHSLKLPDGHRFPVLTALRSSQNYVHAAEKGLSIFEFGRALTLNDREKWTPLLRWLNSSRSQP